MKDSLELLDIYKRYLSTTSDMILILERNMEKKAKVINPVLKEKYEEFERHAMVTIDDFHTDLHKIIGLDYELKKLEESELDK